MEFEDGKEYKTRKKLRRFTKMNGYCILVLNGKNPTYRIVFKSSLPEALKAIKIVKAESEGRIEILKMIDGDTRPIKEVEDHEYVED
jgi:hypothetical protein